MGISGGLSRSKIKQVNDLPGDYSFRNGISSSLSLRLNLKSHLFLLSDIEFMQKGYNYNVKNPVSTGSYDAVESYVGYSKNTVQNYVNNGWFLGYQLGNNIYASIYTGVYYSFYLYSKITSINYMYFDPIEHEEIGDPAFPIGYNENSETITDRSQITSNWDLGIASGINLGYRLNENHSFFISARYYHGIFNTSLIEYSSWQVKNFHRSFVVSFGIEFRI